MRKRFKFICKGPCAIFAILLVGAIGLSVYQSYVSSPATVAGDNEMQAAGFGDTVFKDIVEARSYSSLPSAIKNNLGYSQSEVKALIYVEASLATKASSIVLAAADMISKLSNIAIGKTIGQKEMKEAAVTTIAQETAAQGGTIGEVAVALYKITETGKLVQQTVQVVKKAKDAVAPPVLAANILATVLDWEMTYINANTDGGLRMMWTLNPTSLGRLKMYLVFVEAPNKAGILDQRGVKYYYLKDSNQQWINYYTDMVASKLIIKRK